MPSNRQYVEAARELHNEDGVLEIDANLVEVSRSDFTDPEDDPHGAYVKAWVWVSDDDANQIPKGK